MKGCYCLVVELNENSKINIGKLGKLNFKKGTYVYVGSAMNSLPSRLKRHLNEDKKLHWHIDYLLKDEHSEIVEIIFNIADEKIECELSKKIAIETSGIAKFGCSDCGCMSHLYYFSDENRAIETVKDAYDSIAMPYHDLKYFMELKK